MDYRDAAFVVDSCPGSTARHRHHEMSRWQGYSRKSAVITQLQSTWDLSAIKKEAEDDKSRRVVIVKFPHIVFRWYNRQEKVCITSSLT